MKKYLPFLWGIAAFVLPFSLYFKTLAPTYIPIDGAEFALCMRLWGVCHPPGFPLYTTLGHFFIGIAGFGTVSERANLFSAFCAALAILFVYLTLKRLSVRPVFSLLLALLFSVSYVFWEFSIAADVFSFGTLLIALTFYFVFSKRFYLAVFALGLSASHFYITAILVPVIYWYFWSFNFKDDFKAHLKRLLFCSAIFISGFFPQAVMFLRAKADPAVNWGHIGDLGSFLYFIRRQEFGSIFLLSNPSLRLGIDKIFINFREYFAALFASFAVIPVLIAPVGLFLKSVRNKKVLFLWVCFLLLLSTQLFLLGTINPTGEDNPFQLNKFYLSSFAIFILIAGISVEALSQKFFDKDTLQVSLLLGVMVLMLLFSNFQKLDYSKNYFSRDMVLDSMEQLPQGSVAIVVSHIAYFGGRYEQIVNGKFNDVTLLYFPNEKNKDAELYHPEIFERQENEDFVRTVREGKKLGNAEGYILSTISKNLDRKIFILQGTFEENFFRYLKPYLRPYGLWWRVETDLEKSEDLEKLTAVYEGMRNRDIKFEDLNFRQQQLDSLTYGVSYNTFAVYLGSVGQYDLALKYFDKAYRVREGGNGVINSVNLVKEVKALEANLADYVKEGNVQKLEELATKLKILGNSKRCEEVAGEIEKFGEGKFECDTP